MNEVGNWDEILDYDVSEEEEESIVPSEIAYWRKPIKIGEAIFGDMIKYHKSREEFINDKAKDAAIFQKKYKHVIDGYHKMEEDLKSTPRPEIPKFLRAAPQIRKPYRKRIAALEGKKPQTSAQMYGYLAAKPECNLQIFGSEAVKPMHSCMQLLGFEYEAQR